MRVVAFAVVASAFVAPAFAADFSVPPPAGDPIYAPTPMALAGHLELGVGFGKSDSGPDGVGLFQGAGRVNIPFHNDWNLQVDLNAAATFESGGYSYAVAGPAAHLWHRGPGGAAGILGGAMFGTGSTLGFVGAEANYDVASNATLGAQATFGWSNSSFNYWNVRGWVNYYFNPDTKLRGDIGYAASNGGTSAWNAAATLEHRFAGTPFSAFGQVAYVHASNSVYSSNNWSGLVGVRIFLDPPGTTLQGHDHLVPWNIAGIVPPPPPPPPPV
jgi:hypothetical protein